MSGLFNLPAVAEIVEREDEISMPASGSSLDFLQAVYRDPYQPMHRRMRAAVAALPFEHPKLAVTAVVNGEGFGAKLEAARERAARVIEFRNQLPTIKVD
ncbi:hypothetical protein [Bradyrhizobium sp. NBAIM01]|uniref:hypothetical protein n=1 Tax=Bradyrhizobium sp. NBAIM01 TaxID=2793818 RepID=UPI001CD21A00|nr:hypothetical protein [Bradyrhizobium sp. NBAIM01]MCA1513643.1 hypothetical protein [Bradyrhizobium sp. NBAIM01]